MEIAKEKNDLGQTVYSFPMGYAVYKDEKLFIPAIMGNMSKVLKALYQETKCKKMIFTAVMDWENFRKHLKNIKREYSQYVDYYGEWTQNIEIEYIES